MHFRPLHDRVVVRRLESEERTKGGIIIPDTAKEKPQEGEVVAVGPGARDESGKVQPLDVKAGDRILFGKWSGTEVKIDGEELLIMKESDVMGIIEGTPAVQAEGRLGPLPPKFLNTRKEDGSKRRKILRRRAREDAPRRRHSGERGPHYPRPQGPQRGDREVLRRAAHHQGRRDGRQGNRA